MYKLKKRRTALLLEALIAFSLVALCLFPLIKPQLILIQSERAYMEKMQLDRLARSFFLELKQQLYENQGHTWSDLKKGCAGQLLSTKCMFLGKDKQRSYNCHYQISFNDDYKRTNGESYLLVNIVLNLKSHDEIKEENPYFFALLVEKIAS